MKVINGTTEDKKIVYKATCEPTVSLREMVGKEIKVEDYIHYETEDRDSNPISILVFICSDGMYSTISDTVKGSFFDAEYVFETHKLTFKVVSGKTKSNRDYLDIRIV